MTIVAGPGFGKTVLLVDAMADNAVAPRGRDVWLSCEPTDESADRLVAGLSEAVGVASGPELEPVLDWIWAQAPEQVCLVLDDIHEVPSGSTGAALLDRLLAELPRNGHVMVATRDAVPVRIARLAARGELVRVSEDDLAFDDGELAVFAQARGVDPKVLGSSGGWPAVAELAASAGADLVLDYLWEEVLARLGSERAKLLARVAIAGGGDDDIATAVAGRSMRIDDIVAGVPLLERTETGWTMLHALWRPALRPLLTEQEANAARRSAAAAHRRHGRSAAAFDLLVESEAWDDALAVIGEAAVSPSPDLAVASAEFGHWCRTLPVHLRQTPEALLAAGLELQTRAPIESMPMLEDAAQGFRARGDVDGELAAIAADGLVRWWANDLAGLMALYARVEALAAAGSASARVLAAVGLAAVAHLGGDPAGVLAALTDVDDRLAVRWLPTVHWLRSVAYRRAGDLPRAYAELDAASKLPGAATDTQVAIARLRTDWLQGRVEDVQSRLPAFREHYSGTGDRFFEVELIIELASRTAWLGDVDAAASLLDGIAPSTDVWSGSGSRLVRLIADCTIAVGRGDEAGAASLLRDGDIAEFGLPERVYWRDRGALSLVHVLVPEARASWTADPLGTALVPGLTLAECLEAAREGDLSPAASLRWPDQGVVRAQLPLRWVVELAAAGVAAGNPPPDDLLRSLGARLRPVLVALTTSGTAATASAAKRLAADQPAAPPYRLWVGVIGPLEVRRDGSVATHRELRRERVRELLCYLVARRRVRREAAAEELWPTLDDPGHNLRVNLSYLQRALQPERGQGEPPFFLRANGPWLELGGDDLLEVDAWELDTHLDQADLAERANSPAASLSAYRAALGCWRGEPYADLPFAEWADVERTRIRLRYTAAATRAGELLLASGATAEARDAGRYAIAADATWEPAYRLLARTHLAEGDLAGARRVVEDCRTALVGLGLEPEAATVALSAPTSA